MLFRIVKDHNCSFYKYTQNDFMNELCLSLYNYLDTDRLIQVIQSKEQLYLPRKALETSSVDPLTFYLSSVDQVTFYLSSRLSSLYLVTPINICICYSYDQDRLHGYVSCHQCPCCNMKLHNLLLEAA